LNLHRGRCLKPWPQAPISLSEVLSELLGRLNRTRRTTRTTRVSRTRLYEFRRASFDYSRQNHHPRKSNGMSMHIPFDFLGRSFKNNLGKLGDVEQRLRRENRCVRPRHYRSIGGHGVRKKMNVGLLKVERLKVRI